MKTNAFNCGLSDVLQFITYCTPIITTVLFFSFWTYNGFAQCAGTTDCPQQDSSAQCGLTAHWVDSCAAGSDTICTSAEVGISLNPSSCVADVSLILNGPIIIERSAPLDILVTKSSGICAKADSSDGHLDVIQTEIKRLNVCATIGDYTYSLIAGDTVANPDLPRSFGQIIELPTDNMEACSAFKVWFKVIVTPPINEIDTLYNHEPLVLATTIDQIPPIHSTDYLHIDACIPLYETPYDGTNNGDPVAMLTKAKHETCKLTTHIHTPTVPVGGELHFSVYVKHVLSRPATTPITFKIADMNGNIVYSRATGDYTLNQGDELSFNDVIKLPTNLSPGMYFLLFDIRGMSDPLAKGQLFTIKN